MIIQRQAPTEKKHEFDQGCFSEIAYEDAVRRTLETWKAAGTKYACPDKPQGITTSKERIIEVLNRYES